MVNKDEQVEILASLQSLRTFEADDSSALEKLAIIFKQDPISWVKVDPSAWNEGAGQKSNIGLLREAILHAQFITFNYINTQNEYKTRLVYPYQVIFKDKAWYLDGFSVERNAKRMFKLTRMDDLQISVRAPQEIDGKKPWLDARLEQMKIGNQIPVKLKVSSNLQYRIYEEFPREDIQKDGQGDYLVTTELHNSPDWLIKYLLSFGSELEVLAPQSLRDQVQVEINKMLKNY